MSVKADGEAVTNYSLAVDAEDNTKYKSGYEYYPFLFGSLLIIFVYTLFFFPLMMGKSDQTLKNVLDKQQFSKEYVFTIIIILILIILMLLLVI